jgi:hypothetical protein
VKGTLATSGEFALTGNATTANITIADGATLALGEKGSIAGKIENNGVITSAATAAATQKTLVSTPSGSGTVEISGAGDGALAEAALPLTQNVVIANNGKLIAPNVATPFSGGKTITVASGGTLDLGATTTTLSGATIVNKGTVSTATTSAAALNTILDLKGNITSTASVTVSTAITVPADTKLAIPSGATLAISQNTTFTVAGGATLSVAGTLNVAANANVEVASGGTFEISANGSGDLNGTITVKSGGITKDLKQAGGSLWGANSTGKYVFESGAIAYITSDTDPPVIGTADNNAVVRLTSGTFSNSKTEYTLDGEATVSHNFGFSGIECTLATGSKLTIAINDEMSNERHIWPGFWIRADGEGDDAVYGTIKGAGSGDTAAVIDIKTPVLPEGKTGWGWLTFFVKNASETSNVNFYDSADAKITATVEGTTPLQLRIPFGTYKWDASLGSSTGGWKAQAAAP